MQQSPQSGDASAAPLLAISDLVVEFPTETKALKAVDGVSFDLAAGRTLGMVGESGCGKTVTALSLLGLVPPPGRITGGVIRFEGRDLLRLDERELDDLRGDRLAMIFQEPMTSLNPVYTAGEQIAEVLRIHRGASRGEAREDAVAMLEAVGVPDPATRAGAYPHQLSGGMRQRVMIAMALACRPRVLIADEPTTALDVTIQAQILDLILTMQREMNTALLFISHNLAVISEVADEVAVMYAGRIVERAPASDLFTRPLHPYTRGLIDTQPDPRRHRERLPAIPGGVPDPGALPEGCAFCERCPLADDWCTNVEPALRRVGEENFVACLKVSS